MAALTHQSAAAATLVETLKAATKEKVGVELVLHAKPKGEDGKQQIEELLETVKKSSGSIGVIQKVLLSRISSVMMQPWQVHVSSDENTKI